ncbi:site-specific DNA-methyltransferase [Serratia sp. OLHL2]|uniref:DNA-methyltransferase n=1 Tax=Serratia TaxID=613 RepID=UPI000C1A2C20|nr:MULTISPECIES: site-specific DNA-methyltransferase [Serratia]PII52715.1 site-specific DNA-methyltransferase [Serratia sp. OLEL1]PII53419.1 site-specific DNA-methyltransferase [Serratia sp. OLCL1]PII56532.1 site-specific DNA-methyltransferase [Serratia sp. OLBL1]PII64412.1 site-specific DNA-methyltransferase [Serratia sp. OLHL2]PII69552.1 site-specific DNA-methyltransferase [Serratia sp. OLIL2]
MTYQLNVGRCEEVLRGMADNSVDAIVTDPPYGLSFMGHKWDYQVPTVDQWTECLRVLKPGGHLLAFGGARTYHRLVVNIEDAGFEIRDQLMWIYGSGFPKSKNLTGEHQGKGTALKPAHEPIVMARKPLLGTVEGNVLQFGTGALNIDICRVPTEEALSGGTGGLLSHVRDEKTPDSGEWKSDQLGRWPANVLHDGSEEVIGEFPQNSGARSPVKGTEPTANGFSGAVEFGGMINRVPGAFHNDQGSAARFFYCAKVCKSERDEGMDRFLPFTASDMTGGRKEGSAGLNDPRAGAGRTGGARNNHPTVKPVELMRYLCRLVTPAGGVVLDPFMGSGSTGKAALLEGYSFIGVELDPDHLTTAAARIAHSAKAVSGS